MMKYATLIPLLLLSMAAGAAEQFVIFEKEADSKRDKAGGAISRPLYLKAADLRMKLHEAEEKRAAAKDELSLDDFGPAEDDDLSMDSSLKQRDIDGKIQNLLIAAKDYDAAARPFKCDKALAMAEAIKGGSDKLKKEISEFKAYLAKDRDPSDDDPPPYVVPDYNAAKNAALAKAEAAEASGTGPSALAGLWSEYGFQCFKAFDPEGAKKARDRIAALKKKPSVYPGFWLNAIEAYDNLARFPLGEEEIRFPESLADFGVKEKLVQIAGELEWDADDATKCIQEALDDGATTVVLEDRGQPWRVKTIAMKSNQRLLLKKGVRILQDKVSVQLKEKCPMISIKGAENVIIEGEGDNYIGKFATIEERNKFSSDYGGDGILISGSRNVLIKNVTVGANTQDGVCLGGNGADTRNIYLDNVVLENNYRQAMSVCNAMGLYCRKVTFASTIGGDPMCGIDFEGNFETEANTDCYFFDCVFKDNAGAAVFWSASSYYPVTAYFKRCRFLPQRNYMQINIFARCGVYMGPNIKAPGHIIFEDCEMETRLSSVPVRIENSNLFDVTIRNFKVRQLPAEEGEAGNSPIVINLGREYRYFANWKDYDKSGSITVDGMEVEGFKGYDFIDIRDRTGGYSVRGISGNAVMNGEKIDASAYSYEAPEKDLGEPLKFADGKFLPPAELKADTPEEAPVNCLLSYAGAWFDPVPSYRALYFEGGEWKMKKIQREVRELGLKGRPVAYYFRKGSYGRLQLSPKDNSGKPYELFFEVPPGGRECTIRTMINGRLKNPKGEVVKELSWGGSYTYSKLKPAGDDGEIWSIECTGGGNIKFFSPMYPVVAEKPGYLPRLAK